MRWVAVGVCVGAIAGCGRSTKLQPVGAVEPFDAGPDAAVAAATDAGLPSSVAVNGGRDASVDLSFCPPLDAPPTAPHVAKVAWGTPSQVPFSCDPLPSSYIFPPPPADAPGVYARCASFTDARAASVALDAGASRAALVGTDGIVRIVDVAQRMVIGVLAPPRASLRLAAFSPSGDVILTVASGERQATLWRADTFTPIWTTSLPGHPYQDEYEGAAAFSPDGAAVMVSPGQGLYRLDPATGAIVATSDVGEVVLGAAYGWSGRRIAVLHAPVTGMCSYSPHGGAITLLDPETFQSIATPVSWPLMGDEAPGPGEMAVAANADLLVTRNGYVATGLNAFRLSDGSALPAPGLTAFPSLLTPDGTTGLVASNGELRLERVTDGTLVASTPAPAPFTTAISADGSAIAAGANGANLLALWHPATGALTPTCSADHLPPDSERIPTALNADGSVLAVAGATDVRLFQRTSGALASVIDAGHETAYQLMLSPDGGVLLGAFEDHQSAPGFAVSLLRSSDGVQIADLGRTTSYQGGSSGGFWFSPDGSRLDALFSNSVGSVAQLKQLDIRTGAWTGGPSVDGLVMGFSGDCPLVVGPDQILYRECGGCRPLPLATNTRRGVVSLDGRAYLSENAANASESTVLWSVASPQAVIRTYPPRPEEARFEVSEFPVAIDAAGSRVITTAQVLAPCPLDAPRFTAGVHDVAADTIVDELPAGATAFSDNLEVIAYGAVLWCAR